VDAVKNLEAPITNAIAALQVVEPPLLYSYSSAKLTSPDLELAKIEYLIEKPSENNVESHYATCGRYIFPPRVFNIITELPQNSQEQSLADVINRLVLKTSVRPYLLSGTHYDLGSFEGIALAEKEFNV
jgi:UTP--glucose-1-phosphate uridylyltransferase